jgi:hypothetical protein
MSTQQVTAEELLTLHAAVTDATIRVLYNSCREDFDAIFGDKMGGYLWHKFTIEKDANEGNFICYLDHERRKQLAQAALDFLANDSKCYPRKDRK